MPIFKALYEYGASGATVEKVIDSDNYFEAHQIAMQLLNEEFITTESDQQVIAIPSSSVVKVAVDKALADGTPYLPDRVFEDFISEVRDTVLFAKMSDNWTTQLHPVLHNLVESGRTIMHKVANPILASNYDVENPPLPAWVPPPPVDPTLD